MSNGRWMVCLLSTFALPLSAARGQPSSAEQASPPVTRIWLEPQRPTEQQSHWYPRTIVTRSGKIVGFDAKQLRFIVQGDETESVIASSRLLWFEVGDPSEKEAGAIRLFASGKYAESVRPLLDVLQQRPPVWRQLWISMLAAYAAHRNSQHAIAIELVSQLDKRPLPAITLAWLPIAWRSERLNPEAVRAAKSRLSASSAAVRLVAASWLLSSDRATATSVLKQLSVDDQRPLIARLAETLLWRTATPPQVIESGDQWQTKLDDLPMALQVGPTITLIEKLRSAGQAEAATRLELSLKLTPPFPHPEIGMIGQSP